jgi:hypothetical protein
MSRVNSTTTTLHPQSTVAMRSVHPTTVVATGRAAHAREQTGPRAGYKEFPYHKRENRAEYWPPKEWKSGPTGIRRKPNQSSLPSIKNEKPLM